ncbi:hypothetical protein [Hymenobacter siberiensis]|jgi:chromosome segregation ATPase|uniref:hypothetical protein n=1 Tax=Hymenobacter siberiensis TaxID=2848396 RepID=UPI001C1E2C66|nr:hypothetical protein [Hymenobacter siberiensis]MBU6120497.1 hypothetical protein [Hymenobacter siberiensis]
MNIDERFKQLENVMVEMLRKQDRTVEELARMREGQSELNTKIVRVENRIERVEGKLEDVSRNVLELRRDTEKFQQETTAGLTQIIDLIRGLK